MKKTLVIAEAGVNHNGNIEIAKKLIEEAYKCGADIVKFQTGLPKNVMSKYAKKADYQIKNTHNTEESQLEMANSFTLQYEDFLTLKNHAEKIGIKFLSTPFDIESADYLESIGVDIWKIPSGEITNLPYLIHIANTRKPIIMSTGMSSVNEIQNALDILNRNGAGKISLLHCNTDYPTQYEDVNLLAMNTMQEMFNIEVGYSDHTLGIEVPIAATALGATIIEKHFTLDRSMKGPDHKASLEPEELKQMVISIRNIELAMGNGIKEPTKSEIKNITIARKSIVAAKSIKMGENFTENNITTKRPGNGISPMEWNNVIGKRAIRNFEQDELIEVQVQQ